MTRQTSFSDKIKAGWSKQDIMKYYCLSEDGFEKVLACVKAIQTQTLEKSRAEHSENGRIHVGVRGRNGTGARV